MSRRDHCLHHLLVACVACLAIGGYSRFGIAQQRIRSVANIRTLVPDILLTPRQGERVTHRGWEIHRDTFTVVAESEPLARHAAEAFERAWTQTNRLSSNFYTRPETAGLANNSVLVFVDSHGGASGRKSQNYAVGSQYVVHIVPDGNRGLDENPKSSWESDFNHQLHKASTLAYFHATQLDQTLPEWTRVGMSEYIAHGLSENWDESIREREARNAVAVPRLRRFARASSNEQATEVRNAGAKIRFLLEAEGARYAHQFFAALQGDPTRWNSELARLESALSQGPLASQFETWRAEPHPAPSWTPSPYDSPEFRDLEVHLFTLLRLAERWQTRDAPALKAVVSEDSSTVKVFEFNKDQADKPVNESANAEKNEGSARGDAPRNPNIITVSTPELLWRIRNTNWSINMPGGGWLLADSARDLTTRVELDNGRVQIRQIDDTWEIRYLWDRQHDLVGQWNRLDANTIRFNLVRRGDAIAAPGAPALDTDAPKPLILERNGEQPAIPAPADSGSASPKEGADTSLDK